MGCHRRAGGLLYQSGLRDADSLVANELASIYLLTQAWQRLDSLPAALQADVRALFGWTVSQDEVLRQPGIDGCWQVLAQTTFDDERLRVRATWLQGVPDARWTLLLQYAVGPLGFELQLAPGTEFDGELCFYPGAYPRRAQIKRQDNTRPLASLSASPSDLDTLLDTYADALAVQPFLERHPVLLDGLITDAADHGILRDAGGHAIALHPDFRHPWQLLALSGGQPLTVCGERDGRSLLPLSVWHEGRLLNVDGDFA